MSWIGRWIGNWCGKWFGSVGEQPPPLPVTTARRFGRILRSGDILFSDEDLPALLSSGAVALLRQSTDDYVRFRVPDTSCPPLPEPSTPLDSSVADEAEPERWLYGGEYVSGTGWRFRQHPTNSSGFTYVQPAYTCYDGDFQVDVQVSIAISGYIPDVSLADTNYFIFGIPALNCGVAIGGSIERVSGQRRTFAWAWVNGGPGTGIGVINESTSYTLRISRASGTITVAVVGQSSAQVATNSTGQVQLKLWRDFTEGEPPFVHLPPLTVYSIATQSGAPASVTATTPVIDLGVQTKALVHHYPDIGTLEWRASNTKFAADADEPEWDNPTGSYRYWQVRVTWDDADALLERIELLTDAQRIMLLRRFRDYWTVWDTREGKTIRSDDDAIFGSGKQTRTDDGWQHDSDEERVTTIR